MTDEEREKFWNEKPVKLEITREELSSVLDGIEAQVYWDLSDEVYRKDGYVMSPGSDDPDHVALITKLWDLHAKLERLFIRSGPSGDT